MAKKTSSTPRSTTPRSATSGKPAAKSKASATTASTPTPTASAVLDAPPTVAPAAPAVVTRVIEKAIGADAPIGAEKAQTPPKPTPTHQQIAERAYFLFLAGVPGGPADHWLAAERELNGH